MRALGIAGSLLLSLVFTAALSAQTQCTALNAVGQWAYNYTGWYIPAGGTTPVQISTHGVMLIDFDGKVTGPGTWAMGAPLAGTPIGAGQMLEFEYQDGTIRVNPDCTGLISTMFKFKGLPIPALGPYWGRIIFLPDRNEIEGMALLAPGTEKPMWTYTLKRISRQPTAVTWLDPPK